MLLNIGVSTSRLNLNKKISVQIYTVDDSQFWFNSDMKADKTILDRLRDMLREPQFNKSQQNVKICC